MTRMFNLYEVKSAVAVACYKSEWSTGNSSFVLFCRVGVADV
ncbi:hypothetical protein [uncultured Acetobacteroides sp.]|nr:hypothetical protein [uncultured Acetobacteroides sp.]